MGRGVAPLRVPALQHGKLPPAMHMSGTYEQWKGCWQPVHCPEAKQTPRLQPGPTFESLDWEAGLQASASKHKFQFSVKSK